MTHANHAALTILTCGLWLPLWILCALLGWILPTQCTFCGNPFKDKKPRWLWYVRGRKEWLCGYCNQTMERRNSSRAMRRR